jgi:hypothetical protein
MIERELADLLLKLQASHQEAAHNDSLWTPSAIAFHWNLRRVRINGYGPEEQEAYKQRLLAELAEAGSTEAWVDKLIAERHQPASPETELSPEFVLPTETTPDPASKESASPAVTQPYAGLHVQGQRAARGRKVPD